MERLTFEGNFCDIALCAETPGGSFCESGCCTQRKVWERLKAYEDAEEQGRLVELPCKVGATVYGHSKAEVSEYKVAVISLATYNWYLRCQNHNSDFWVTDADIGRTIFLTREEAEAALRGGSDG